MRDEKLVSIVMPTYNAAAYIETTILSVISQTYQFWELLIVDDCSVDGTIDIVNAFDDPRIKVFRNKHNMGAAISRNYALTQAKGKWIAFLDSDDLWLPEKLQTQLEYMKQNECHFSFTDYCIDFEDHLIPYVYTAPDVIGRKEMYRYCYFSTITVMFDIDKVGLIQIADLKKNNDYAIWLKAVDKTICRRIPLPLSIYRKHQGSISSGSKVHLIKYHYLLFRNGQGFGWLRSAACTFRNMVWGVHRKMRYKRKIDGQELSLMALQLEKYSRHCISSHNNT